MKNSLLYSVGCLFRLGWVTLSVIAALVLVKHFVFDIMPVSGVSMFPNFHDRDVIVLNKISYVISRPKRGDDVVLRFPGDPNHQRYIKRLIGLPGEKVAIRDGHVSINGQPLNEAYLDDSVTTYPAADIDLRADQYFLLGDNRDLSSDSRIWGTASRSDFIGKALFIIFPFDRFQTVVPPAY